jgi:hypothetical protein
MKPWSEYSREELIEILERIIPIPKKLYPPRSREELAAILLRHCPEAEPLTEQEIDEWVAHCEACGGYENTALGPGGD